MDPFWSFFYSRLNAFSQPVFMRRELLSFPEAAWRPLLDKPQILSLRTMPVEILHTSGAWLEVETVNGHIYGYDIHEEVPDPILLTQEDVTAYDLNPGSLITTLREANGIHGSGYSTRKGFHFLGRCTLDSRSTSIYLSLGAGDGEEELGDRMAAMALAEGQKIIVFPVMPNIQDPEAFAKNSLYATDLRENLRINWPEELVDPNTVIQDQYAFIHEGATWRISYLGETFTVQHSVGARYVAHLLQHPQESFNPTQLKNLTSPEQLQDSNSAPEVKPSTIADHQTIKKARERLDDIRQHLEALPETDPEYDRLEMEKDKLEKYLASTTGLNGRLRNETSQFERDRKAVGRAFSRFIEAVEQVSAPFVRYISSSIKVGTQSTFTPQDGETWKVCD